MSVILQGWSLTRVRSRFNASGEQSADSIRCQEDPGTGRGRKVAIIRKGVDDCGGEPSVFERARTVPLELSPRKFVKQLVVGFLDSSNHVI